MATQEDLFDSVVRRRIALERYSSTQVRLILRFLRKLEVDLNAKVAGIPVDRKGSLVARSQEQLLASVRDLYTDAYRRLRVLVEDDARGLAKAETEFQNSFMDKSAGLVNTKAGITATFGFNEISATQAFEIAIAKPMSGKLFATWLDELGANAVGRIEQSLRISFAEGESLKRTAKRIADAHDLNRRSAEAIVRTANTHVSAQIADASYDANSDFVEGWEFVATLDSRTTLICAGLDGQIFELGTGPKPPRHINCRSTTFPKLLGIEPEKRPTYAQWLKRQSKEVQDDILGPARGKLYRAGKITVDRFTDAKGKTLTLKQLSKIAA